MNPVPSRPRAALSWLTGSWSGPLLVAGAGLTLTLFATVALRRVDREFAAEVFQQRASRCCVQVAARLESLVSRLSFAERLVLQNNPASEAEWSAWFRGNVLPDYSEVLDLVYSRVDRMPSYSVEPDSTDSGERATLKIQYWTSVLPNSSDSKERYLAELSSSSQDSGDVAASVHRAITIGKIQVSGLLNEVARPNGVEERRRVRLFIPVFSIPSQTYRSTNLVGILSATMDIPRLMDQATEVEDSAALRRACNVQNDAGDWIPVAASAPKMAGPGRGDLKFQNSRTFFGRTIQCEFWSDPRTDPAANRARPWVASGLGLVFTGLLSGLVWAQGRSRRDQTRIAAELRAANERLAAVTRERERLTRDLHDGTIQSIYALGFDLQRVRNVVERDPAEARAELTRALASLNEVVSELRDFIVHEDTGESGAQNVESVLQALVQRVRRNTQAEVALDLSPEAARLVAPRQAVEVLQIVREAITNSLRHAFPRQIGVALTRDGSDWRLTIADDGTGFEPRRVNGRIGHGLRNLQERADELGGECQIVSAPSTGTAIRVVFPVLTVPHSREPEVESR